MELLVNGRAVSKGFEAGAFPKLLSRRRYRSLGEVVLHPQEGRLPEGEVEWVEVGYGESNSGWMGWFLGISTGAALVAGRLMKMG